MNIKSVIQSLIFVMAFTPVQIHADLKLASLFTDDMVIQRDVQANIWGLADPGEEVNVKASWGESSKTKAGADGKWFLKLQTPRAGGPHSIEFKAKNTISLNNVMSGDVWLCSGQSNMEWALRGTNGSSEKADYPQIRLFRVKTNPSPEVQSDVEASWATCTQKSARYFSGTAYFFGKTLHEELKVPIGLIQSAVGGTCIEAWTEKEQQLSDPMSVHRIKLGDKAIKEFDSDLAKKENQKLQSVYQETLASWEKGGKRGKRPRPPRLKTNPLYSTNYPGNLYNGMIKPLQPFSIKGAIWYQGEANSRPGQASDYHNDLKRLITTWRKDWGQGDFPFYFVQLPNFGERTTEPIQEHPWVTIREQFLKTAQSLNNTGMAITIDIGEAKNLHPRNKRYVGKRLAMVALGKTYNKKDQIWTGPLIKTCRFDGDKAIITFDTGNSPLAIRGEDELQGFAVQLKGGEILHANAEIKGNDTLVVSVPGAKEIEKVYYAWKANPEQANLINEAGLPASPFRYSRE